MAKEIKAIQCPKCGSTEKNEIRPEFYRCNSCQTEYFLDNDNINDNVNQRSFAQQPLQDYAKMRRVFLILFGVIFGFSIIISAIRSLETQKTIDTYSVGEADKSTSTQDEDFSWSGEQIICGVTDKGAPIIIKVGEKEWGFATKDERNGIYIVFYNPETKVEIKTEKIASQEGSSSSTDLKLRKFSDRKVYCTVNKTKIFQINLNSLEIKDVSVQLFKGQSALSSGVATMEFVYDNYGDGLNIMANDGTNYYYYPLVGKLYTKEQFDHARSGYNTTLTGAKERYDYLFTSKSDDFPNEKNQLLKVRFKDNVDGPKDMVENVSWSKDYGGSGIFTDRDPWQKKLINDWRMETSRILSFNDITPGRSYFKPGVLYCDDAGTLLIEIYPNASPDALPSIQSINAITGAINWTYPLKKTGFFDNVCSYKGGFLFVQNNDVLMLDKSGKEISTYKI